MPDQLNIPLSFNNIQFPSMDYEPIGIKGVGKNRIPIMSMDQYIDHSKDKELHIECCKGLAKCHSVSPGGMLYGGVPPFEKERYNNNDSWDVMLRNIEKYDPDGTHRKVIEELLSGMGTEESKRGMVWRYTYYALGAIIPWFFTVHLKAAHFTTKTNSDSSHWTAAAREFPNVIKYIEGLPFKNIGRILFFTSYPNSPIVTHRDSVVKEHSDHNINLYFTGGDRKSYIYDPVTEEKIYLEKGARSYFFNNRDFHGVEAEPVFRYTLRIDGTFTDDMCEKLGLEKGMTWKWDYEK
jgi:hypothetical protein